MFTVLVSMRPSAVVPFASVLLFAAPVFAQQAGFADPPDGPPPRTAYVARDERPPPPKPLAWGARADSVARLSIGPVLRANGDAVRSGLGAGLELGHGPAALRLSGAWVRVGYDDPLQQYTGEIVLYLFEYGRVVTSVGAGGGLARTKRIDAAGNKTDGAASVGVGTGRLAFDYRIPFPDTDARAGVFATAVMPAMRGEGAPSLAPWALIGAGVTVGF